MIKGALVGFGAVAEKAHVPAFNASRQFSLQAVAESRPDRRRIASALLPGARVYPDLKTLLSAEKSLDFVDIATPPFLHAPLALEALKAGRHVLCEKPLAFTLREFARLKAEAAKRRRVLFTIHNWKHAPLFSKLKGLLRSGAIGTPRHLELHTLRDRPAAGAPSAGTQWRTDRARAGGGILIDHGWHAFYLAAWLLGASPLGASGSLWAPSPEEAEQEAACLARYPQATAAFFLSWRAAQRLNRGLVYGDGGVLEFSDDSIRLTAAGRSETFTFPQPLSGGSAHPDWLLSMLSEFSSALRAPEKAAENLAEASGCLKILEELYRKRAAPRRKRASPA